MRAPDLYAISDRQTSRLALLEAAGAAFAAGLGWLQVREKDLPPRELFELVVPVVALARRYRARVVVNDRADVAVAAGAHGVQLGESSMAVAAVRAAFPSLIVGASVHSLDAARAAARAGADFLVFGPVFATPSKAAFGPPQGIERLRQVASGVGAPVVAVGGIGPGEVMPCVEAGATGVAAIRGLLGAADVGAAVKAYRAALGRTDG